MEQKIIQDKTGHSQQLENSMHIMQLQIQIRWLLKISKKSKKIIKNELHYADWFKKFKRKIPVQEDAPKEIEQSEQKTHRPSRVEQETAESKKCHNS